MRITQKDIARDLGLSLITVSRALNGSENVSEKTKKRIQEYVNDHNYVPHKASQVLVRNRIRHLSLFSSTLPYYFWKDIRKGIGMAADQLIPLDFRVNYNLIPDADTIAYLEVLRQEIDQGADAIALVNQPIYDMDAVFGCVRDAGVPYITFNVDAPNSGRLCYVGTNYYSGGRLAAEIIGRTLRFKKESSVLIITTEESRGTSSEEMLLNLDRLDGFIDVLRARFPSIQPITRCVSTTMKPHHADEHMEKLLGEFNTTVDAVYLIPAVNAIFLEALEKFGYRNAVVIVHDLDESAAHYLDSCLLTAVIHQSPVLQGYFAVKTLERIVEMGITEPMDDVNIVPSAIFTENQGASTNNFLMDW